MIMESGKAIDATNAVAMEDMDVVEEDVVVIQIDPTTPGMVLTSKIFLGVLEVLNGILFRDTDEHMLAINAAVIRLVEEKVTEVHMGDVSI